MDKAEKTDLGLVKIKNEVIASIAGLAAKEVKGVSDIGCGLIDNIYKIFKPDCTGWGVKVDIDENKLKLNVPVIVEYGVDIPQVAMLVQENVRSAIEKMTGLNAVEINVNIQGVKPAKN
jgi:uncharacterized alkaline shock family protein YloU